MAIRFKTKKDEIPKYLNKISCGKEILNIIKGVSTYSFDNDEPNSEDEARLMSDFFHLHYSTVSRIAKKMSYAKNKT